MYEALKVHILQWALLQHREQSEALQQQSCLFVLFPQLSK
jgi:hypothetical protein